MQNVFSGQKVTACNLGLPETVRDLSKFVRDRVLLKEMVLHPLLPGGLSAALSTEIEIGFSESYSHFIAADSDSFFSILVDGHGLAPFTLQANGKEGPRW